MNRELIEVVLQSMCDSGLDDPTKADAQAAIEAAESAGYALVPVEATEAQVDAFIECTGWAYDGSIRDGYKAMLAEAAKQ